MANSKALFSDLKAGKRLSIVEARLLRLSEARNVKRPSRFRLGMNWLANNQ